MELKEMIAELLAGENDATVPNGLSKACGFAAEALALVAWAEERRMAVNVCESGAVCCDERGYVWCGDTLLGCISAAKEAYENQ